uniref:Uncharacterized protein n=2 Tax=Oryza TaxID=4527 RepID=Q2QYC2_ORYSJ|nr:hypothetical protein LOC_Os12g03140 [Oryza sativa Japonica Group]
MAPARLRMTGWAAGGGLLSFLFHPKEQQRSWREKKDKMGQEICSAIPPDLQDYDRNFNIGREQTTKRKGQLFHLDY